MSACAPCSRPGMRVVKECALPRPDEDRDRSQKEFFAENLGLSALARRSGAVVQS